MYAIIVIIPLITFIINSIMGRKIGKQGSITITNILILISAIIAYIGAYEIIIGESMIRINLGRWVMSIDWGLKYDELTIIMSIIVLTVSISVMVYTSAYMESDPHIQRFNGSLSLFIFFMLVVVTSSNYLGLFLGWEGMIYALNGKINSTKEGESSKRIGPHNSNVISIMIGLIIGKGEIEKRTKGNGVRLKIKQSNKNVEYLMWLHKFFAYRGYCNPEKPRLKRRVGKGGRYYSYVINTYTFGTLLWLYEMFYKEKVKIIPKELELYITPLSLAIWFMGEGGRGMRIETGDMKREEVEKFCRIIKKKLNIECSQSGKYIKIESEKEFIKKVKPYMIPSMYYKLGNHSKGKTCDVDENDQRD